MMEGCKTSLFIVGRYQNDDTKVEDTKQVAERLKCAGFDFVAYISECWPCEILVKPNGKREEVYGIFNSVCATRYRNRKECYTVLPEYRTGAVLGNVQIVV